MSRIRPRQGSPWAARIRRLGCMVCLLGCWLAGCAKTYQGPRAQFADADALVVLPIRDPIGKPSFEVEVEVEGPAGSRTLWMLVDSGFSAISVPESLATELGFQTLGKVTVAAVGSRVQRRAVVAKISLGGLVVDDAMLTLSENLSVVGQSALRHAPWEVSWAHGTLTLNARRWADDANIFELPLKERGKYAVDEVSIRLGTHRQTMLFDTGALVSTLPGIRGQRLGFETRPFDGRGFSGAAGRVAVSKAFLVELGLGPTLIPSQRLVALPDADLSMLGLDVLSRFDLYVEPGKRVLMRPRADVRLNTSERLGRWSWLPPCEHPGCMSGKLQIDDGRVELSLNIDSALPAPLSVAFVCSDPEMASSHSLTLASMMTSGTFGAPFGRIVVRLPKAAPGRVTLPVPHARRLWFAPDGSGCERLSVLDLVPEPANVRNRVPQAVLLP